MPKIMFKCPECGKVVEEEYEEDIPNVCGKCKEIDKWWKKRILKRD